MTAKTPDHFQNPDIARTEARAALMPVPHAVGGPAWDRFIQVMRVLLPAGAIVLGSITVLWPFLNDAEVSFTLSKDEVAKSDGQIRMTNMQYTGTDTVDRLFRIQAGSGLQDTPGAPRIRLTDIKAEMELEPGNAATVSARTGIYRTKESTLSLVGGVHVATGNGYILDMAGAEIDLKAHKAVGQGSISGTSRLGTLSAGRVEILVDDEEAIFEDNVKLTIAPRRPASGPASGNDTKNGTGQ